MDTTRESPASLTVDRALVDSIALDLHLPDGGSELCECSSASCTKPWSRDCTLGFDFAALEDVELEIIPVVVVGSLDDTCADDPATVPGALARELEDLKASSAAEIADLRRLLSLSAAALEPHVLAAPGQSSEQETLYTAIAHKLGLSTPIFSSSMVAAG